MIFLTGCSTTRCGNDYGLFPSSRGATQSSCKQCNSSGRIDSCSYFGVGFLCTDSLKTKSAAKHLAKKHMPNDSCSDYKDGFRQAFVDVSMGACGQVPAIAPKKYWKYCDRTVNGHASAQSWFGGYQAGAQIALGYQDRFLDIATSQQCGFEQLPNYQIEAGY